MTGGVTIDPRRSFPSPWPPAVAPAWPPGREEEDEEGVPIRPLLPPPAPAPALCIRGYAVRSAACISPHPSSYVIHSTNLPKTNTHTYTAHHIPRAIPPPTATARAPARRDGGRRGRARGAVVGLGRIAAGPARAALEQGAHGAQARDFPGLERGGDELREELCVVLCCKSCQEMVFWVCVSGPVADRVRRNA